MAPSTYSVSQEQCQDFARLSGDFNPLHLNPDYAYKTMFGHQVVFGVYQVIKALDVFCETKVGPLFISSITAEFKTNLAVGENFCVNVDDRDGNCIIKIAPPDQLSDITTKIKLSYSMETSAKPAPLTYEPYQKYSPQIVAPGADCSFQDHLSFNQDLAKSLFPQALNKLSQVCFGALLMSTRVVGMRYPGLNSIFRSLELHFEPMASANDSCQLTVMKSASLFNECSVGVASDSVNGCLQAFFRPEIVRLHNCEELIARGCKLGDTKGQRALVVGGSNGIGAQCVRMLALSGAEVLFSYFKRDDSARELQDDLLSQGVTAEFFQLDSCEPTGEALDRIKAFAPTHIYYFATPKIAGSNGKILSEERFQQLARCYIFGLENILRQVNLKNIKGIFSPSSVSITDLPKNMLEYSFAKGAFEVYAEYLKKRHVHIATPRLSRINTSLSQSLIPVESMEPEDALLPLLKDFLGQ